MQAPIVDRSVRTDTAKRNSLRRPKLSSDFAQHLVTEEAPQAEEPVQVPITATLAALLGLQESEPEAKPELSRQRVSLHGTNLLRRLDQLRMELLDGRISAARLTMLAQALTSERPRSGDAQLDSIIGEIELRVEVEIAKMTSASDRLASSHGQPVVDQSNP